MRADLFFACCAATFVASCAPSAVTDEASQPGLPAEYVATCRKVLESVVATGDVTYEMTTQGARAKVNESAWNNVLKWDEKMVLAKSLACVAAGPGGDISDQYVAIYGDRSNTMMASGTMSTFKEK